LKAEEEMQDVADADVAKKLAAKAREKAKG
jgi:hypothetical protein